MNIATQDKKADSDDTINDDYIDKILLYGYVMLFACSFSLGPFIFLFLILIDLRVDAKRLLWLYKRPVATPAHDKGKI